MLRSLTKNLIMVFSLARRVASTTVYDEVERIVAQKQLIPSFILFTLLTVATIWHSVDVVLVNLEQYTQITNLINHPALQEPTAIHSIHWPTSWFYHRNSLVFKSESFTSTKRLCCNYFGVPWHSAVPRRNTI